LDAQIVDLGHFVPNVAKVFPNLKSLSILYNPGVPNPMNDENKDKYQQHRYYVISRLPKLENLDALPVTEDEKKHISNYKVSDFSPVVPGGVGVLASLKKDTVGFQVAKQGELTIMQEQDEYCSWHPSFVKTGEGKLLIFKDAKHARPETIVSLQGYEVSVVEDQAMLSKLAPQLELLELKHTTKPRLLLVAADKPALQEWLPILVSESLDRANQDWDEIERQSTRMKFLQEQLAERSSQIRLKRALDQSYAIDANEIKLIKVLGHGGFGTVYQATVRGKAVAVKVFHNQKLSAEALDDFCNEVEILAKIHHPQVINFIGACLEPLMIVTELMAGGDMEKLLLDSSTQLSFLTRLQMAKDAALGMAWLHGSDPMILHRDVKTANFLVDENLRVVVADFGLSDKLKRGSSTWDDGGYKGTIYYTSPEVLKNAVFNEKADVYSFGLVLWQILTREHLYPEFKRVKSNELEKKIFDTIVFNNFRPTIPAECPEGFRQLIEDCWASDADQRPQFSQIVERIDEAIYSEAIPNKKAREQWLEWFPGRHQVRWKSFWEHFVLACENPSNGITPPKTSSSQPSTPRRAGTSEDSSSEETSTEVSEDTEMKLLVHELMSPNEDIVIHQVNSGIIHIDQFGNFIQSFGPLHPSHNSARCAHSVAKNKWFFGQLSINQTFNLLNGQAPGTYLIRFSLSRRGDYSASFVTPSGSIAHQHIDRRVVEEPTLSIKYVIPSTGASYDSLEDLVDDQQYLRVRCTGWPFAWIFANRTSSANIDDTFLDTSTDPTLQSIRSPRKH
jgi:serine/threonine protein kinase